MASYIKRGESLFIPFKNGESIYDSQLKPRMYKTKDLYDRFSYRFAGAEMVEYAEVCRCKECINLDSTERFDHLLSGTVRFYCPYANGYVPLNHFCSYGEKREGERRDDNG